MFRILRNCNVSWISYCDYSRIFTHRNILSCSSWRPKLYRKAGGGNGSFSHVRLNVAKDSPTNRLLHNNNLVRYHSSQNAEDRHDVEESAETVTISYVDRDGDRHIINGKAGDNVMYLAQRHDLDVEGACEASLACCTCHVYVKDEFYDKLGDPTEEEEDMLDLAPFLQENSRLSCQIILSKDIDGIEVQLPSATRNFYVDGHKPKHH